MNAFAQALTAALLHFVWQASVAGFLAWFVLFVLRQRSANSRYLVSCVALGVTAVLPVITLWLVYQNAAPMSSTSIVATVSQSVTWMTVVPAALPWFTRLQAWALPVWACGVLLLSLRLVLSARQAYSLRRHGEPAQGAVLQTIERVAERLKLSRPVRALTSSQSDGPAVVGWIRPVVLLPSATMLGLTPEQLEAVIAHELAHIKRFDYLVNMLQMLVETLLFYHPAVWWLSARIRHERELCCDDLAVHSCGDAVCYARALTRLERLRISTAAAALGSTGGPLLYRIQRLLGVAGHDGGYSRLPGVLALLLVFACVVLEAGWAAGYAQQVTLPPAPKPPVASIPAEPVYVFFRESQERGVNVDAGGATVMHRNRVEYPGAAIEKRIEGNVVVEVTLHSGGAVEDAHVVSGPVELRRAALESVLQWHFAPGTGARTRQVSIAFHLPAGPDQTEEMAARIREIERAMEYRTLADEQALFRNRVAERQADLSKLEQELQLLRDQQVTRAPEQVAELQLQLEQAQARLEDARRGWAGTREESSADGRTLRRIEVTGLSDQVRVDLMGRLQVHIGDLLTREAVERVAAAVHQFDQHLELEVRNVEGNQVEGNQVDIRIMAPGQGRR